MSDKSDNARSSWKRSNTQLKLQLAPLRGHSLSEIATQAADTTLSLLTQAQGATVTQLEGNTILYIAAAGTAASLLGRRSSLIKSFTGRVIAGGRGQIFDPQDHRRSTDQSRKRAENDAIRSGMIVPITVSGLIVGTLGVVSEAKNAFEPRDLETLEVIAQHIASRLQHSRKSAEIERIHRRTSATRLQRISDQFDVTSMSNIRNSVGRVRQNTPHKDNSISSTRLNVSRELQQAISYGEARVKAAARFETDISPHFPTLSLRPGELWQNVLNLLINAAQAIPKGEREKHCITLKAQHTPEHIIISVTDTGIGIDPSIKARIFEPFFSTRGHTGMGLAVVSGFAETAGGSISVQSTLGAGSVFTLKLPVRNPG